MRILGYDIAVRKAARPVYAVDERGWNVVYDSGLPVNFWQRDIQANPDIAQAHYAVHACRTVIAGDIGKLGVNLTRFDEAKQIPVKVTSNAVTPVLTKPNGYQTWQQFIESWLISKTGPAGNTYVLKVRDNRNVVVALHVLDPCRSTPMVSDAGDVFYRLNQDRLAQISDEDIVVPASEIIHDRYPALFHPLVGVSPLFASGLAATHGMDIQTQAVQFFKNRAVSGGILVTPQQLDDQKAKMYQARWQQQHSGGNLGRVAVLGNGLDFKPTTQTALDSQLVEQLNMSAKAVCSAYHVPPWRVHIGERPTYENAETDTQNYYGVCLQPHVQAIENLLTIGLDLVQKGYEVQLDENDLNRMDPMRQMEFVAKGIEKAVFSPNEGRRKFGYAPVEGGDDPMIQQQNYSLPALAKRDAKDDPFESGKPVEPPAPADDSAEKFASALVKRLSAAVSHLDVTHG